MEDLTVLATGIITVYSVVMKSKDLASSNSSASYLSIQ
jgi:hypothetical protein